jgi:beta-barrel assembly-enhancing protease
MDDMKMQRRTWLCGVCALGAASALPAFAQPALADQAQEKSIGQQVYADQRKQGQVLDQSAYYPVVREVGARIAAAAQPHWWPMNFVIVKGAQPNAFSTPGGWVYVNEALLKNAANNDELANVLGHETGHIVLGHVMNRLQQAQNLQLLLAIGSLFVHSQGAANTFNLAQAGASYGFLNFSRQQEYQADHEGVILAGKANYNPWGMVWFFRTLSKLSGNSSGFEAYVQDHPSTPDRISRIQQFFGSDPAQFAAWKDNKTVTAGLRQVPGSAIQLVPT